MPESTPRGQLRWLWLSVIIIVADFASKYYVLHHFAYSRPWQLFPGFDITLLYNTGAAFSLLDGQQGWQVYIFAGLAVLISLAILIWISRLPRYENVCAIGLCLILGGALGNLYDRLAYTYVIDFIDIHYHAWHWPAFNIADAAICSGAFLVILRSFARGGKDKKSGNDAA